MDFQNKSAGRTTRFLVGSFTILLLISIGAFVSLSHYMSRVSEESIDKVGDLYMSGINGHIFSHFQTLIDLKLEQVESLTKIVPDDIQDVSELHEELINRVRVRNFNYLALCTEDGRIEMLYGEPIQLTDPDPFFESLKNGEKKVAIGTDAAGNEIVLFGISVDYMMSDGERSTAVVTAVPVDYISSMLGTDEENALIYSHIIRKDGSFIVSDMRDEYPDYFTSLYSRYPNDDPQNIEKYINSISEAMAKKESYFTIMNFESTSQQIYCTSLPYSEWYLLTILPFGTLNETIESLNQNSIGVTALVCAIILIVLLIISK